MSTKRRAFTDEFKAKVALEALKEQETIAQIASRHDVLPVQVSQWKAQLLERLPGLFSKGRKREKEEHDWQEREARLFQKIGQLEVERDWLKKKLHSSVCSPAAKRAMVEPRHQKLSVVRQCALLELPRSTAYYRAAAVDPAELALMNHIDRLYTEYPFYGSRQMRRALRREGVVVNRKRVSRLMRKMGLEAQCPQPDTSKPAPGHVIYPYLMKSQVIDRPQQAWCSDITYIRMEGGFVYLVAIMDWHSRQVLAWEISNTLDAAFCLKALRHAIALFGAPGIMNTDQGCQYTSDAWISELKTHGVQVSMDGRGRAMDNVFVERLWRTVKYEEVYRREYGCIAELRHHLAAYFRFYNHVRPHSVHDGKTPVEIHGASLQREAS